MIKFGQPGWLPQMHLFGEWKNTGIVLVIKEYIKSITLILLPTE